MAAAGLGRSRRDYEYRRTLSGHASGPGPVSKTVGVQSSGLRRAFTTGSVDKAFKGFTKGSWTKGSSERVRIVLRVFIWGLEDMKSTAPLALTLSLALGYGSCFRLFPLCISPNASASPYR